jgi:hypothetical protein
LIESRHIAAGDLDGFGVTVNLTLTLTLTHITAGDLDGFGGFDNGPEYASANDVIGDEGTYAMASGLLGAEAGDSTYDTAPQSDEYLAVGASANTHLEPSVAAGGDTYAEISHEAASSSEEENVTSDEEGGNSSGDE